MTYTWIQMMWWCWVGIAAVIPVAVGLLLFVQYLWS